jgi:hypothetical protein
MYCNGISNFSPIYRAFLKNSVFLSLFGGVKSQRSELISINDDPPLVPILPQSSGDHLHRHTNLNRLIAHVGQLRRHHRAFIQLDDSHRIRRVFFKPRRRLIDGCVRVDFAPPAKLVDILSFLAAFRANIPRWENFSAAMRANFARQTISLLAQAPVARYFHHPAQPIDLQNFIRVKRDSERGHSERTGSFLHLC